MNDGTDGSGSDSYIHHDDESPFFADITLDLAEAHDIAETPEPTRKQLVDTDFLKEMPKMPPIPDEYPVGGFATNPSSQPAQSYSDRPAAAAAAGLVDSEDENRSVDDSKLFASISSNKNSRAARAMPSSRRWPRDIQWAVAFCIIVPLCLLLPMIFCPDKAKAMGTETWMATAPAPRLATLHTLLWGYGASLVLSRLLYRTMGGGDGDDARHVASQVLLLAAPISVSVYVLLVVVMYLYLPHAMLYLIIPLWFLARDIFLFRSWKMTATTPGGRQAFFQALTCMTLDILSRSLRRSSFYRIVSLLVIVQLIVIGWWRWALLAALKSQSLVWIFIAALGGKWATGTVARLLTLIAAGGIQSWFAQQESMVQEMEGNGGIPKDDVEDLQEEMIEFATLSTPSKTRNGVDYSRAYEDDPDEEQIPEAYRTADASMYKSALVPDEGIDDDFEDEHDEGGGFQQSRSRLNFFNESSSSQQNGPTVKHLLFLGLTQSFGSVAKCGLLGGFAQFVWSQIRKIDTARATFRNLQGMSIGNSEDNTSLWGKYMLQLNLLAREFVRNNSDMAMSHVAAFSKNYQRAAQDVAILIDESGTCVGRCSLCCFLRTCTVLP